jgi:Cof subfamily protein (haloacid dehalogenase superfamily)
MNKVLVIQEDKEEYEISYRKLLAIKDDFDIVRSSSFYIEIIPKGINKRYGLQKIAEHFHISPNEILALGDQENDVEMISYVKYGIAMENAIQKLKDIAYDVTTKNTEDGVAHAINKYVISKLENN